MKSIKSIEQFLQEIEAIHGDTISIDVSTYKKSHEKVRFIDKDYGEWWATPANLLNGRGHKQRGIQQRKNKKIVAVNEIIKKIKEIYGDLVTLKSETYKGTNTKAIFIDKDYGEWSCSPANLLFFKSLHPTRANVERGKKEKQETLLGIIKTLQERYGDLIKIKEETYQGMKVNCTFIDKDYGEWTTNPQCVIYQNSSHPQRSELKRCETNIKNNGVPYPAQNSVIALKQAISANKIVILKHWENNQEIGCHASWEKNVVLWLNENKIKFIWKPKKFNMPFKTKHGYFKTYEPDLYLPEKDLWVEIKGYKRPKNMEKWEWFHKEHPNSELWDRKKLRDLGIKIS